MTSVPDIKLIRTDTFILHSRMFPTLPTTIGAGLEVFDSIKSVPDAWGCQPSHPSLPHEPYPQTIYHPFGWK